MHEVATASYKRPTMADSATIAVAIAGLITTGGTSVLTLLLTERRERRRLEHERASRDIEELRRLIDQASEIVVEALDQGSKRYGEIAGVIPGVERDGAPEFETVDFGRLTAKLRIRLDRRHALLRTL